MENIHGIKKSPCEPHTELKTKRPPARDWNKLFLPWPGLRGLLDVTGRAADLALLCGIGSFFCCTTPVVRCRSPPFL